MECAVIVMRLGGFLLKPMKINYDNTWKKDDIHLLRYLVESDRQLEVNHGRRQDFQETAGAP